MADVVLTAVARPERGSRPSGRIRRAGQVPAVVYGLGEEATSVSVGARELSHILAGEAGANTLITLEIDGQQHLTLARQIQRHPTRGDLVHVDFIRIRRDVAVMAEVPLEVVGEAPGTRQGGMLDQVLFHLTVEAMPADIPSGIEVEVGALDLGDQIRVGELTLPPGVSTPQDPDDLVVHVTVPRGLEEAPEEAAEGEEGEAAAEPAADAGEGSASAGE